MREFDTNGLRLAEYVGKLFEASIDEDYSSPIFLRRFIHSELLKVLEKKNTGMLSLDVQEGLDDINHQFGESKYGIIKYNKDEMFWIGYLYMYIAYTRESKLRFVMHLFKYDVLRTLFYSYHTQDNEWCIRSLLELYGYTEQIFNNDWRLKQALVGNKMYFDLK